MRKFFLVVVMGCVSVTAGLAQWTCLNPYPTPRNYIAIQYVSQQKGYALTTEGILVNTTDGGLHWNTVNPGCYPGCRCTDLVFRTADKGYIVGANGLIIRTDDGGLHWDSVPSGTHSALLSATMISDSTGFICGLDGTILKTTDGGATWKKQHYPVLNDYYDISFVTPEKGFIASNKNIFRTLNGGDTWELAFHADSGYNAIRLSFVDTLQGFAVGRIGGIFRTEDGGASWKRVPSGTDKNFNDVVFVNSRLGFVAANDGMILKSTDGGRTWAIVSTGYPYGFGGLSFADTLNGSAAGPLGTIFRTSDGGSSWTPATYLTFSNLVSLSFADEQNGFAAGQGGTILKTTDGGLTWTVLPSGTDKNLRSVSAVSPDIAYVAGEQGLVLKTTDGGNSWYRLTAPAQVDLSGIKFSDENHGIVTGFNPVIYRTENGGASWIPYETETNAAINAVSFYGTTGYACGSGATLLKSADGGISWSKIVIPELYFGNMNKVSTPDAQTCYVVGNQNIANSWVMYFARTNDGGHTWRVKTLNYSPVKTFMSLYFTDAQTGYAGGSDFLWKTTDGGETWIDQTPAMALSGPNAICFVNSQLGIATGYSGQILRTTNGGGLGTGDSPHVPGAILEQNYPNPFQGQTRIRYTLKTGGRVLLTIMNSLGREIGTPVNTSQTAGTYTLLFDAPGLPPGIYFYRLITSRVVETRRMIIY